MYVRPHPPPASLRVQCELTEGSGGGGGEGRGHALLYLCIQCGAAAIGVVALMERPTR